MYGCGRSAWVLLSAALVVMPWATSPRRRAAVTVGGDELAHRATVLWAQLAPGRDGTRPSFLRATALFGAPIALGLRCGRRRRIACPDEEWTCALLLPEVDPTADESNGTRMCVAICGRGHRVTIRHLDERWERNEFAELRTACAACEKGGYYL
ncbi:hypothetical protein TcCL_NonESM08511 [Trypanosoma cruzi]|nr:hypothetical protein TcCL_NonESM08511 [Trypanosoma cruzi]